MSIFTAHIDTQPAGPYAAHFRITQTRPVIITLRQQVHPDKDHRPTGTGRQTSRNILSPSIVDQEFTSGKAARINQK